MNFVAYYVDSSSLQELRLYCLLNNHKIVSFLDYGTKRRDVLKDIYAKADGLIVQNIAHITRDTEFLIALDELKSRGKHLIAAADSIDTTRPGGDVLWIGLQNIAREARVTKMIKREQRERPAPPPDEPEQPTLRQAWTDFRRTRNLSANTLTVYDQHIRISYGDWQDKPISEITKAKVEARHRDLTVNKGPTTANLAGRILRSVINFARIKYERPDGSPLVLNNPVNRLSELRAWNREKPRKRYLNAYQYRAWWQAVEIESHQTAKDFLTFLALTGCRRSEATNLKWSDVNFDCAQVTFRDTKNYSDHTIPVCAHVFAVLQARYNAPGRFQNVFTTQAGTPYELQQQVVNRVKARSGAEFSVHDLRRGYATMADALRIPEETISRLLNHKQGGSITSRYIVREPERYRQEVEAIAVAILGSDKVDISLPRVEYASLGP